MHPPNPRLCAPTKSQLFNCALYYVTSFHELAYSTGNSSRFDRGLDKDLVPFGSPDYSYEELVAEMDSAFLCAIAGISPSTVEQRNTAYVAG